LAPKPGERPPELYPWLGAPEENSMLRDWLEKSNKRKEAAMQMHSKRRAGAYANDMLRARVSEFKKRI
jgi:hypothetical protein